MNRVSIITSEQNEEINSLELEIKRLESELFALEDSINDFEARVRTAFRSDFKNKGVDGQV